MFDLQYMLDSIPQILKGVPVSIFIASISIIFGLIIGFFIALSIIYKVRVLNKISLVYVSFFRGTPLLVQIFLCYYGIPVLVRGINLTYNTKIDISAIPSLVFICTSITLNLSAYLSETIRGAILSVPKGQVEAAASLGMTTPQIFTRVLLPQALNYALPNLGNICISTLKDTSLAFVAAVPEIIGEAKIIAGRTSKFFEVYIVAALIYWMLCIFIERIFKYWEKKSKQHERNDTFVRSKSA